MNFAAALLLPFALQAAEPAPVVSQTIDDARFNQCVARIDADPNAAYEEGMAWAAETTEIGGYRCAAMALVAQDGRAAEGARRLESLATIVDSRQLQAELFAQAGNAYILAYDAGHARSALTRSIAAAESFAPEALPDLLIDRARAFALERNYRSAEEDLSRSLDLRPNNALALRLRASARMHQNAFDLAETDAAAAVALEPTNIDSLLMLGHTREAKRTGQAVVE